jgi:hypothetical protein
VHLAVSTAVAPFVSADQDPGGTSLSTGSVYVLFFGILLAVLLSCLLIIGRGRWRERTLDRDLARDLDRGFALLERQLADVPIEGLPAAADARERLAAARALYGRGSGLAVLRAVRHTLLEGLAAAHYARTAAGREPGPRPPSPNDAVLTAERVDVELAGVVRVAQPRYEPGYVHHFAGGTLAGVEVPGGWYAEPFWDELLLGPTERASSPADGEPPTSEGAGASAGT